MSVGYVPILWNKQKKIYDRIIAIAIALLLTFFIGLQLLLFPNITIETLIIRATAFVAIVLLHVILMIGPLSRLDRRFLPLLYNRRHLGVTMFLFAATHGIFCIIQFHTLGNVNALVSVFTSNEHYREISSFPFQTLGFVALIIFFLMAATSHDFWLKNLGPNIWKGLHMLVYVAYVLIILHVALGILQYEDKPIYWSLLLAGFALVATLQVYTGIRENRRLNRSAKEAKLREEGFYEVCTVEDIPENRAKIVFLDRQNIAIFKYEGKVSAIHNVCKHQMGPLGEGKIVDGCITCPWHGYQYLPENGQSPPPFTEKVATYRVALVNRMVWVHPQAFPEGTYVEPARIT